MVQPGSHLPKPMLHGSINRKAVYWFVAVFLIYHAKVQSKKSRRQEDFAAWLLSAMA